MSEPERALPTSVVTPAVDEEMVDWPTVMRELRASMTSVVKEPWLKTPLSMVTVFFEVEHEAEDLKASRDGASKIMVQPQPVTPKEPMSKSAMSSVSEVMALPVMVTSPAVMSVKVPGCMRAMVRSPEVTPSRTASELEAPLPVCEVPPGRNARSLSPRSTSMRITDSIASMMEPSP